MASIFSVKCEVRMVTWGVGRSYNSGLKRANVISNPGLWIKGPCQWITAGLTTLHGGALEFYIYYFKVKLPFLYFIYYEMHLWNWDIFSYCSVGLYKVSGHERLHFEAPFSFRTNELLSWATTEIISKAVAHELSTKQLAFWSNDNSEVN